MSHTQAHSYYAAVAERNAIFNDATAAHKASRTNVRAAIEDGPGRYVAVIFDHRIMLHQRTRVDDAVCADPGTGVDDGTVHHDRACANAGVNRDMGHRRDYGRQGEASLCGLLIQADARRRRTDLANSNQCVSMIFRQALQVGVCGDDGITEVYGMQFLLRSNQAHNLVTAMLFDHINTGMRMAAGTDEDYARFAHIVAAECVMELQKPQADPVF